MSIYNKEYTEKLILEQAKNEKNNITIKDIIKLIFAFIFCIPIAIFYGITYTADKKVSSSKIKKEILKNKELSDNLIKIAAKCQEYIFTNIQEDKYIKKTSISSKDINVIYSHINKKNNKDNINISINLGYFDFIQIRKDTNYNNYDDYNDWDKDNKYIINLYHNLYNITKNLQKSLHSNSIGKIISFYIFDISQIGDDYDKGYFSLEINVESLIKLAKAINKEKDNKEFK